MFLNAATSYPGAAEMVAASMAGLDDLGRRRRGRRRKKRGGLFKKIRRLRPSKKMLRPKVAHKRAMKALKTGAAPKRFRRLRPSAKMLRPGVAHRRAMTAIGAGKHRRQATAARAPGLMKRGAVRPMLPGRRYAERAEVRQRMRQSMLAKQVAPGTLPTELEPVPGALPTAPAVAPESYLPPESAMMPPAQPGYGAPGMEFYDPTLDVGPDYGIAPNAIPMQAPAYGVAEPGAGDVLTPAQDEYLQWMSTEMPDLYAGVMDEVEGTAELQGLGQDTAGGGSIWDSIVSTVQQVAPAYVQYKQQKSLLKTQTERAKKGLPPLQTAEYAPAVKVITETGSNMTRTLMLGAAAVGLTGLLLFMRKKGRR